MQTNEPHELNKPTTTGRNRRRRPRNRRKQKQFKNDMLKAEEKETDVSNVQDQKQDQHLQTLNLIDLTT